MNDLWHAVKGGAVLTQHVLVLLGPGQFHVHEALAAPARRDRGRVTGCSWPRPPISSCPPTPTPRQAACPYSWRGTLLAPVPSHGPARTILLLANSRRSPQRKGGTWLATLHCVHTREHGHAVGCEGSVQGQGRCLRLGWVRAGREARAQPRQEQRGLSLQGDVGAVAFASRLWQSPFCNCLARTGGAWLVYSQPHCGKAGFSPSARSPLPTPTPTLQAP